MRLLALLALLAAPAFAQDHSDQVEDLPEAPGREEVFFTCTACHGFAIIGRQGLTRARWDQTINDMIERHEMPAPRAEDRALMLDYLAGQFPPRARGPANPFLNR